MNKVVTTNLNNRAYQIEENGYDLLLGYLDQTRKRLKGNPDRDEIMADFEQAVAEKCDQHINTHKNVVTESEIKAIIEAMGPAETSEEADTEVETRDTKPKDSLKRIYIIKDGSMIAGVCTGIAAYLNVDVTLVRIIFVMLALLTGGVWVAVYIALMFIMPVAQTPEQKAEARGYKFNAQELIDRAKHKYAELGSDKQWSKAANRQREAMQRATPVLEGVVKVAAQALSVLFALAAGLLSCVWGIAMWQLVWRDGVVGLGATDPWVMIAWLTSSYLTFFIILTLLARATSPSAWASKSASTAGYMLVATVWAVAVSVFVTISLNNTPQLVDSINSNQNIVKINDASICLGEKAKCIHIEPHLLKMQ